MRTLLITLLLLNASATFGQVNLTAYKGNLSVAGTNFVSEHIITNGITIGGVRKTAWPATGTGDLLSGNTMTNLAPLLGGGGVTVYATNTAGFKVNLALGNVDNTSDANKPVSTAQQSALDLKADLASPALTGNPTAPTQSPSDNSDRIATTLFVNAAVSAGGGGGGGSVPVGTMVSSGIPTTSQYAKYSTTSGTNLVPDTITLASTDFLNQGTSTTVLHGNAAGSPSWGAIQLNTAQVSGVLAAANVDLAIARLNSPTFTGIPTVPTASPGTSDITAASTLFVNRAVALAGDRVVYNFNAEDGLLAVDSSKTNGIFATNQHVDAAIAGGSLTVSALTNTTLLAGFPVLADSELKLVSSAIFLNDANIVAGVLPDANIDSAIARNIRTVSTKTTGYTVLSTDSGTLFSNSGAGGAVIFTLPAWASGLTYTFDVEAAQSLTIDAPGTDTIRVAGSASVAGGNITANTIGNVVTISATISGKWVATAVVGTWTVN